MISFNGVFLEFVTTRLDNGCDLVKVHGSQRVGQTHHKHQREVLEQAVAHCQRVLISNRDPFLFV